MSTMPDHLRPITVEIPVTWTAEQALAVWEILDPKSGSWPIPLSVMAGTLQPVVGVHPGLRRSGG